jgi:hypothetical protein
VPNPDLPGALAAAVPVAAFLDRLAAALAPHGFHRDSSLVALSTCRDELAQPLAGRISDRWGPVFALGGLGGLPPAGGTMWAACLGHVPDTQRGRLLAIGLTHIGLGADGSAGTYHRPWMTDAAPTCAALSTVVGSWEEPVPQGCPEDREVHDLRAALHDVGPRPEHMVEATVAAAEAVRRRMVAGISGQAPWDRMDVAVVAGVQVHTPEGVGTGDRIVATAAGLLDARGLHAVEL